MSSWNLAPKVYSQAAKAGRHAHQQWWETPSLLEICVHVKLEPSANRFRANLPGGKTMPTREGGKQHLCLRCVSMSSYALEQKRLEPTIVWRELMPMLEYMRNHVSTHTRMVVYLTIRTTTSVYINAQHTP